MKVNTPFSIMAFPWDRSATQHATAYYLHKTALYPDHLISRWRKLSWRVHQQYLCSPGPHVSTAGRAVNLPCVALPLSGAKEPRRV